MENVAHEGRGLENSQQLPREWWRFCPGVEILADLMRLSQVFFKLELELSSFCAQEEVKMWQQRSKFPCLSCCEKTNLREY